MAKDDFTSKNKTGFSKNDPESGSSSHQSSGPDGTASSGNQNKSWNNDSSQGQQQQGDSFQKSKGQNDQASGSHSFQENLQQWSKNSGMESGEAGQDGLTDILKGRGGEMLSQLIDSFMSELDSFRGKMKEYTQNLDKGAEKVKDNVKANPFTYVAVALGLGILLGKIVPFRRK